MKKKTIALSLVPLIASVLMGCDDNPNSNQQWARTCVDKNGVIVDNSKCIDMYDHNGYVPGQSNWFYYWYYYSNMGYYPSLGSRVPYNSGGQYSPPDDVDFGAHSSIGVTRGGFGSTGGGFGSSGSIGE